MPPDAPSICRQVLAYVHLLCAAIEIAGQENFFWSASTEEVRDVSETPFEDNFFQAYSEFKSVFNLVGFVLELSRREVCGCVEGDKHKA